ncbi:hypothetical protein H2O64_16890 [Kordia sp. YSTF-M3]|uniref:Natural product n=2 Tax=Kordia aestuariivivens TaxID=2759037 RepID=A0ABR7QCS3_9FLAO|nr:hypothetical protein [Kordia aestuariivivens]
MMKNILNIKGVSAISKEEQGQINGGAGWDISKCGCDCAGRVTGPKYCPWIMACPQVYTCGNDI